MNNPGGAGDKYFYATLIPGDLANSQGWTTIETYSDQLNSSTHYDSSSWGGSVGVNWGFWSVSAGAQHQDTHYNSNLRVSNFHLKMQMAQGIIHRPAFFPEFFINRGWTLTPGHGWTWPSLPSNGAKPPTTSGTFIGYPTAALFVKGVEITSAELAQAYHQYSSSTSGSASVGWGPFQFSGSYATKQGGTSFHSNAVGNTLQIPGMALIGFVCHLFDKCPNPVPTLKNSDFTGN
jgi:hypothetical protein